MYFYALTSISADFYFTVNSASLGSLFFDLSRTSNVVRPTDLPGDNLTSLCEPLLGKFSHNSHFVPSDLIVRTSSWATYANILCKFSQNFNVFLVSSCSRHAELGEKLPFVHCFIPCFHNGQWRTNRRYQCGCLAHNQMFWLIIRRFTIDHIVSITC